MSHQKPSARAENDDPRRGQLTVGLSILVLMVLVVPTIYIIWHFVPGFAGEFLGVFAGIISTPFLLEAFFLIFGIILVVFLNNLRLRREGDGFVYLDEIADPAARAGLPDRSTFAIYKDRPLDGVEPAPLDQIEGAIELGDHLAATRMLAMLGDAELRQPDVLSLRIRLARATGKDELATRLERVLSALKNPQSQE